MKMTMVAAVQGCSCMKDSASELAPAPLTTFFLGQHDLVTGEPCGPWPQDDVATLAVESLCLYGRVAKDEAKSLVVAAEDASDSTSYGTPKSPKSSSVSSCEGASIEFSLEEPGVVPMDDNGSVGHPDFCSRPCIYFVAGTCSSGSACGFCHLAHDKYPLHLDKRNRLSLSRLSFAERMDLILPIISERIELLGLSQSLECIAQLRLLLSEHPVVGKAAANMKVGEGKKLVRILKCLRVHDLISRLKPEDAPLSIQLSIEILGWQMREEVVKGKAATSYLKPRSQRGLSE